MMMMMMMIIIIIIIIIISALFTLGYWLRLIRPLATIMANMPSQRQFSTNEIKPNQVKLNQMLVFEKRGGGGEHRENPLGAK